MSNNTAQINDAFALLFPATIDLTVAQWAQVWDRACPNDHILCGPPAPCPIVSGVHKDPGLLLAWIETLINSGLPSTVARTLQTVRAIHG